MFQLYTDFRHVKLSSWKQSQLFICNLRILKSSSRFSYEYQVRLTTNHTCINIPNKLLRLWSFAHNRRLSFQNTFLRQLPTSSSDSGSFWQPHQLDVRLQWPRLHRPLPLHLLMNSHLKYYSSFPLLLIKVSFVLQFIYLLPLSCTIRLSFMLFEVHSKILLFDDNPLLFWFKQVQRSKSIFT